VPDMQPAVGPLMSLHPTLVVHGAVGRQTPFALHALLPEAQSASSMQNPSVALLHLAVLSSTLVSQIVPVTQLLGPLLVHAIPIPSLHFPSSQDRPVAHGMDVHDCPREAVDVLDVVLEEVVVVLFRMRRK
jgi:hypothetical protein